MSLSILRIMTVIIALGIAPFVVSCGHDASIPEEQTDAVAREVDRYIVHADLKPVDEADVNADRAGSEAKAGAADEAMVADDCDPDADDCSRDVQEIEVEPS